SREHRDGLAARGAERRQSSVAARLSRRLDARRFTRVGPTRSGRYGTAGRWLPRWQLAGLPGDISLELVDRLLLFLDDGFDEIADRDHADDLVLVDDRQVTNAPVRHDLHALAYRVERRHGDDGRGHDLRDRCVRA